MNEKWVVLIKTRGTPGERNGRLPDNIIPEPSWLAVPKICYVQPKINLEKNFFLKIVLVAKNLGLSIEYAIVIYFWYQLLMT